jgi:cytochrome c oxidase subunit II
VHGGPGPESRASHPSTPERRAPIVLRRTAAVAASVAALLLTSGCVKEGISAKATDVHRLFFVILWLALPVFLFVEGMLLVAVVRFRKRAGDESAPPQIPGNRRALTAFFAGPLAIVVLLLAFGEVAVARVDRSDPSPAERLVVTGFQWEWSARYLNEEFTVTGRTLKQPMTMELPVDASTEIELRSTDVIHEFYVPDLLFMKNAVPGHPNVFTIRPTKLGTYRGQCAQYCGLWHSKMTLILKVVPQADFSRWVTRQKTAASGAGSCSPRGSKISLVAKTISWDKTCLAVAVGLPFQITIDNQDKGIDHDFAIYDTPKLKHRLYLSSKVTGPGTKTFTGPALPAGKYYFQCDIHGPAMSGTFVVG